MTDLAAASRLIFDIARRARLPGESLRDALVRVLYWSSPAECRAAMASIWSEGDRRPGETDAAVVTRLADRFL